MTLILTEAGRNRREVLVTDGGNGQSRSSLAAVRALAAGGYVPSVTVSGPHSLAAASRHCRRRLPLPAFGVGPYAAALSREVRSGRYLGVLPSSDRAVQALCAPGHAFLCKEAVASQAAAIGIPVPLHQRFDDVASARAAAGGFAFPVIVKPTTSRFPAVHVASRGDLAALEGRAGPVLVQEYVRGVTHSVSGVVWEGELAAVCHQRYLRTWPAEAGTSCAAETTGPDEEIEERLLSLLSGYSGIFQAQFVAGRLIDVNPRVYGSLPLAVAAGLNLPALLCDLARSAPPTPFRRGSGPIRARPGLRYRWWEGDLRHLTSRVRGGRMSVATAARALFPRRGTTHSVWALRDPAPMLTRARFAAAKCGQSRRTR